MMISVEVSPIITETINYFMETKITDRLNNFVIEEVYSDIDLNNNKVITVNNVHSENIAEEFKVMQDNIMKEQIPILTKLLAESDFDTGYESLAEKYFYDISNKYGIIADTILQNIYLNNMYENNHILKHLLFIIANLPKDKRANLEIVPLAGISNPDIEIQDLSVRCFEAWEEKKHIKSLISLKDKTNVSWFKDYINDVIEGLEKT